MESLKAELTNKMAQISENQKLAVSNPFADANDN